MAYPKSFVQQRVNLLFANYDVTIEEFFTADDTFYLFLNKGTDKEVKGIVHQVRNNLNIEIRGLLLQI